MPFSTREGDCLHKHFTDYISVGSQFMLLQDSPVFDMDYVSESVFEEILSSVFEERFPEIESLTEHQRTCLARSHKWQGCVCHTANRTWKVNYISVAP